MNFEFLIRLTLLTTLGVSAVWCITRFLSKMSASWKSLAWIIAIVIPTLTLASHIAGMRFEIPMFPAAVDRIDIGPTDLPDKLIAMAEAAQSQEASETLPAWGGKLSISLWGGLWSTGVFITTLLFAVHHVRVRWILKSAVKAPFTSTEVQQALLPLNVRPRIAILISDSISAPFCYGILRPSIVLPADALEWSEEKRRVCLMHEAAHLRRGDLGVYLLSELACIISWFNPLIWHAAKQFKQCAESATDDAILNLEVCPTDYAHTLVEIAENSMGQNFPMAIASMARRGDLRSRVTHILNPKQNRTIPTPRKATGVLIFSLLMIGGFASMRLVEAAASPVSSQESVTVDDLADILNVEAWKTLITEPMGAFSVTIYRITDGKVSTPLIRYVPPPKNAVAKEGEVPLSILSVPAEGGIRMRMTFKTHIPIIGWVSNSISQIVPTVSANKFGTFTRSLPPKISFGDYVMSGEAPSDSPDDLRATPAPYVTGLLLRIEKIPAKK